MSTGDVESVQEAERETGGGEEVQQARLLFRLSAAINRADSIEDVYEPALDVVTEALRVHRASVLLFDAAGVMRFRAWRGLSDGYVRAVEGHSPWAPDAVDPEPVLVSDVHADDAWRPYREVFDREGIRALGFFPLVHGRRLLGKFMVYGNEPRTFGAGEVELAQTIAAQISQAVARGQLFEAERIARQDAERNAERLRRLLDVTESLSEAATPAEVAEVLVAEGVAAAGAVTSGLWQLDLESNIAALVHSKGYSEQALAGFATIDVGGEMPVPVVDVFRYDQPVWLDTREELAARYPQLAAVAAPETEYHRTACVPVRAGGRCVAALAFTFDVPGGFEPAERDFLLNLARQGSLALERSQLLEAERQARVEAEAAQRRLSFKAEASAVLAASIDYTSSLATVAKLALPRFADWCVVELGDSPGQRSTIAAEGAPDPDQVALARATGSPSAISGPITIQGNEIGALLFGRTDPRRPYDASDLDTAVMLGQRAGLAIENARLQLNLERAVKARDDLLAVVSHDLRTPLGVVSMKATLIDRLLPDRPDLAKVKQQLAGIQSSAMRMEDLINDLQDMGSIDAGRLKIEPQPEDLGTVLGSAADDLQAVAASKSVRLDLEPPAEAVRVRCDSKRIRQVLSNLIGNAVKFTAPGGSIVIRTSVDDGVASVVVRDDGPGIAGRDLSRIFERYYQGPAGQRSGVGLGLFIAKAIVDAHGGRIWVESTPGDGSAFHFTLPLDRDAAP
jgi:signal transduction histidine kinase